MLNTFPFELILASASPRRKQFLEELAIPFSVEVREIDETFPNHLKDKEIATYIAEQKASAFTDLESNQVVLTGDTVVWNEDKALGKPSNHQEAFEMIQSLSGKTHEVISAFCLKGKDFCITKVDACKVHFKSLTEEEINYYIENFQPFDKAGAYGIQEWIGQIGIDKIEGSFYTVMGMPVHLLYQELVKLKENWHYK